MRGIYASVSEWMGNDRLDRLERQARSGYASPSQMLKLIEEVRRRRSESSEKK